MTIAHSQRLFAAFVLSAVGCNHDFKLTGAQGDLVLNPSFVDLGIMSVGQEEEFTVEMVATEADITVLSVDVLNVEGEYLPRQTRTQTCPRS